MELPQVEDYHVSSLHVDGFVFQPIREITKGCACPDNNLKYIDVWKSLIVRSHPVQNDLLTINYTPQFFLILKKQKRFYLGNGVK